jgi:hypothetical protein
LCDDDAVCALRCRCLQAANAGHPRWRELCDPTSAAFASRELLLAADNHTVLSVTGVCVCGGGGQQYA